MNRCGLISITTLALAITTVSNAKILQFLDTTLDGFTDRVVKNEMDKQPFKTYYLRLLKKMQESDEKKQRSTKQYLYVKGLSNLEEKYPSWHKEANAFFTDVRLTVNEAFDQMRGHLRRFLQWYGAYEEYMNIKYGTQETQVAHGNKKDDGLWGSIKSYANKMTAWFGFEGGETDIAELIA